MIALVGDAELDEGNVYECLLEGWKHGLRNTWWVIDYNRQSLDGVVREGLYERIEAVFQAFNWNVVTLKYGALQRRRSPNPAARRLKAWIDACPNGLYSALMFRGGAAWRERLSDEIGDQGPVSALLTRRSDDELATLMANLGGHCTATLLEQFEAREERPADSVHRLYGEGMGDAARGPQGQSRRADDSRADRDAAGRDARPDRPRMGAIRGPRRRPGRDRGVPRRRSVQRPTAGV